MLISRNGTDFFLWLNMALMAVLNGVQRLRVYSLFVARGKWWRLSSNNGLAGVILHPLTMPSHNQTRVSSPALWPNSETSVLFCCIQIHIATLYICLASDKKIKVTGLFQNVLQDSFLLVTEKFSILTVPAIRYFALFRCFRKDLKSSHCMAFREILYWELVLRSVEKIQFWLKSGKRVGYITWRLCIDSDMFSSAIQKASLCWNWFYPALASKQLVLL